MSREERDPDANPTHISASRYNNLQERIIKHILRILAHFSYRNTDNTNDRIFPGYLKQFRLQRKRNDPKAQDNTRPAIC